MFKKLIGILRILKAGNILEKELKEQLITPEKETEILCWQCDIILAKIFEVKDIVKSLEIIIYASRIHISETGHIDFICPKCRGRYGFNDLKPLIEICYKKGGVK